MNVLFMTLGRIDSLASHSIYCDLLKEFVNNGHYVSTLSPGKNDKKEEIYNGIKCILAHIDIDTERGKNNYIKKGLSTLLMGEYYIRGIKQNFNSTKFDLILYTTPPITFIKAVQYVKNRDGAKTYLLLKDIFPQNAVDIGLLNKRGIKGLLYRYFRHQEKKLYVWSDKIGCMSQANVDYLIKNNPYISPGKIEICPNSIQVIDHSIDKKAREIIRSKYNIPLDKVVYIYGGNLGKPQGIPHLIDCLNRCRSIDAFFVIIGDGSEYEAISNYIINSKQGNVLLMKGLPKEDYDNLVASSDIGLVFLDHRFTIPNFPSRILSYMQAGIPVLACTDKNTDIGKVVVEGGFGWWCESDDAEAFYETVLLAKEDRIKQKGDAGFDFLKKYYSAEKSYKIIMES